MKKKTIWITSAAVAAALVAGGGLAIADPFDDSSHLTGSALDTASSAALDAVGSGTVTDTEAGDAEDSQAYEVEVTLADGTDVDVALDKAFAVLWVDGLPTDGAAPAPTASSGSEDNGAQDNDAPGTDDNGTDNLAPLTDAARTAASDAALAAIPAGTVGTITEVERSDDLDHAYEVEVTLENGEDIDVELDESFTVLKVEGVPAV